MTLIDQAVMKAFQRHEKPAAERDARSSSDSLMAEERLPTLSLPIIEMPGNTKRELFVHSPETRLRGLHHSPNRGASPDSPDRRSCDDAFDFVVKPDEQASGDVSEPDDLSVSDDTPNPLLASMEPETEALQPSNTVAAVESVMNTLLSYELSIQASQPDGWQIATDTPIASVSLGTEDASSVTPQADNEYESPPSVVSFRPAWETDAFQMPVICQEIQSDLKDRFQLAASELMDDCVGNRPVINVTGTSRSSGRTTVSILLASALARAGLHVLLVEGDAESADLAEQLGVDVDGGWSATRTTLTELAECCVQSLAEGFCFLPRDPECRDAGSLFDALNPALWHSLAGQFDVVLVDSGMRSVPPVEFSKDLVGAHIVVKDARHDLDEAFEQILEQLRETGPAPIRVVENFALLRSAVAN